MKGISPELNQPPLPGLAARLRVLVQGMKEAQTLNSDFRFSCQRVFRLSLRNASGKHERKTRSIFYFRQRSHLFSCLSWFWRAFVNIKKNTSRL